VPPPSFVIPPVPKTIASRTSFVPPPVNERSKSAAVIALPEATSIVSWLPLAAPIVLAAVSVMGPCQMFVPLKFRRVPLPPGPAPASDSGSAATVMPAVIGLSRSWPVPDTLVPAAVPPSASGLAMMSWPSVTVVGPA